MNVMQAVSVGGGITLRGTLRGLKIHRRTSAGQVATIDAQLTDHHEGEHEIAWEGLKAVASTRRGSTASITSTS